MERYPIRKPWFDFMLHPDDPLTRLVWEKQLTTWHELVVYIRNLPFGQISHKEDLSLVILEQKGSCSTKHAFLKRIAALHEQEEVKLFAGMYQRTAANQPNLADLLEKYNLPDLPEAHCYLKIRGQWLDITTPRSMSENNPGDFTNETEITTMAVADFKKSYHLNYLKGWIIRNDLPYTLEQLWRIREESIFEI